MVQRLKKKYFFPKIFLSKIFFEKYFFWKNIFDKKYFRKKNIFFGIVGPNALKWLYKIDKFWYFKKSLFTKSFVNFSPFSPANMVPASGGHLSGGWNQAGSFSYDLISSELLLEHDFFKIDINGWSPTAGARLLFYTAQPHNSTRQMSSVFWARGTECRLVKYSVLILPNMLMLGTNLIPGSRWRQEIEC